MVRSPTHTVERYAVCGWVGVCKLGMGIWVCMCVSCVDVGGRDVWYGGTCARVSSGKYIPTHARSLSALAMILNSHADSSNRLILSMSCEIPALRNVSGRPQTVAIY